MKSIYFTILLTSIGLIINAQTTFQKTYGGLTWDECFAVDQTNDSGFVMAGFTNSFGFGSGDLYLVKTDKNGDMEWSKAFGGTNIEWGKSVEQTLDGGFIIGGHTESFGAGGLDFCLIKTDNLGNVQWTKTYGGTGSDKLFGVRQTLNGGFIMTGRTTSFGDNKLYLVRADSNGVLLWSKTFNTAEGGTQGYFVLETSDNGFFVVGSTVNNIYWLKTDGNGNHQWSAYYNTIIGSNKGYSAAQTTDGGFIITGEATGFGAGGFDVSLIKLGGAGDYSWGKYFGGANDDRGHFVQQCSDGGFLIAGSTESFGAGGSDLYTIKTDGFGNLEWSRAYGGVLDDYHPAYGTNSVSAKQCNDGSFIIAGSTESFGAGGSDFYLIKTDSAGISACNESDATSGTIVSNPGYWGDVGSTGVFVNIPQQTVSVSAVNLISVENLLCSTLNVHDNYLQELVIQTYPNPFNTSTTIQTDIIFEDATLTVYNIFGQQVKQLNNISGNTITLNRDNLPSGVYFIRIIQNSKTIATNKLIITD